MATKCPSRAALMWKTVFSKAHNKPRHFWGPDDGPWPLSVARTHDEAMPGGDLPVSSASSQIFFLQFSRFTFPNTLSQTRRRKTEEGSANVGNHSWRSPQPPDSRTHLLQQLGPDTWSRDKWEDMNTLKSPLWDSHSQPQ